MHNTVSSQLTKQCSLHVCVNCFASHTRRLLASWTVRCPAGLACHRQFTSKMPRTSAQVQMLFVGEPARHKVPDGSLLAVVSHTFLGLMTQAQSLIRLKTVAIRAILGTVTSALA